MKKGRYETSRKHSRNHSKSLALVLSLVLVIGCVAGGTLAWLSAKTDEVKNTFSTSGISINLDEGEVNSDGLTVNKEVRVKTEQKFKMIPGWSIEKDPKATVFAGSEKAWMFVKIVESANFDTYMTYGIADVWETVVEEKTA